MTYCSVNKVRLISGLDSQDIGDQKIRDLRDEVATSELNKDINQKRQDERIFEQLSSEKDNNINGKNKTFHLKGTHRSELQVGDKNDDGRVNASDLEVFFIEDDDKRVEDLNVVLEDREVGRFSVELADGTALDQGELYVSYVLSPVDQDGYEGTDFETGGPNPLIETACAQLTSAYAFTNIEASKLKDFSIGNVTINSQSEGARIMRENYMATRRRINQTQVIQSGENENTVRGALNNMNDGGGGVY
jgi:hypothetical protein